MSKTGYVNGSDVLVKVGEKAVGHCTSHVLTLNAEAKSRSVKPPFSSATAAALWDDKSINKMSATVKGDGLAFYNEGEGGYKALLAAYKAHTPVTLGCYERGANDPYASGNFIITSLELTSPAGDDATYSFTAENAGAVAIDESKLNYEIA